MKTRDYKRLATIADKLQRDTDFDYVVIGDRHSIRLYHPNPEKIGYPMQFTKPGALEKGESYFITGKGSIGMAMRAKTPIFDDDGKVIGVVSIGYLVSKIDSWRAEFLLPMACVCRAVRDFDVAVVVPGRAYPSADDGHGAKANRSRSPSARGAV